MKEKGVTTIVLVTIVVVAIAVTGAAVYLVKGGKVSTGEGKTGEEGEIGVNYVPGDVIVGFHDNVSEEEANALVESYGLTWESHFPTMFSYWVEVLSGSPRDFMYYR